MSETARPAAALQLPFIPALGLLTLAYAATAYVGLKWATVGGAGSPVWPASGVALAGLLIGGIRLWPAILIGRLLAAILSGSSQPLWAEASIASANALGAATAILLLQRAGGLDRGFPTLSDLLKYIGCGALVGALISASLGTLTLIFSSGLTLSRAAALFANWTVGNFVGAVILGSAILAWAARSAEPWSGWRWFHLMVVLAATGLASWLTFVWDDGALVRTWHIYPALVWAALAFHLRGASAAILVMALISAWGTSNGLGQIADFAVDSASRLALLQQFIGISGLTILILAVISHERREKEAKAREAKHAAASEERLRAVIEQMPIGVSVATVPSGDFVVFNSRASEIFRHSLSGIEDLNGHERYGALHADGAPYRPDDYPLARAVLSSATIDCEPMIYRRGDGKIVNLEVSAAPIRDAEGQPILAVSSFVDVTERKRAEERELLLAREVDHRSKNLLGVVQSIVHLAQADDVDALKTGLTGRIQSLARTHSLLAAARWEGVDLKSLVSDELAPYASAVASRVQIDGPPLRLKPAAAQALALVLHELSTNAAKYGSLSAAGGELDVSWTLSSSPREGDRFCLDWSERSGPAVEPPTHRGFGSTVLRSSIERQLKGAVSLNWERTGLVCSIAVPVQNLLAVAAETPAATPASPQVLESGKPQLAGVRVLVLEDEALIAMQIEAAIADAGCIVIGPASRVDEACDMIAATEIDAALLDVNVADEHSFPVADLLASKQVPFAFCTGYAGAASLPDRFADAPVIAKPFTYVTIQKAVEQLLKARLIP
jgi:PAS domain S-box-containing protein